MKALIWKEWREQRIFLLMIVGLLLCITAINIVYLNIPSQTSVEYLRRLDKVNYSNLFLGWVILPAFFALILGAAPFVKEFLNNTQDFLIQRPISTAKIFWLKFFFGIILLLLITQLCHLVLYVPNDSFQMQISAPDFKYPTPLTFFYLPLMLIYSAVFLSSLLLKRELPAILLSPLTIAFGLLYILPLYLILFIILSPKQLQFLFSGIGNDITLYYFPTSILLVGFALFGFVIWQKAISKGVKATKVFFTVTGIIFAIYFVTHTILNISTGLELSKTLKQTKMSGTKLRWEEIIPPSVPKEENAALVYQEVFDLVDKLSKKYKDKMEYLPWEGGMYSADAEGVYRYYNNGKLEELTTEQKEIFIRLLLEDEDSIKLYSLIEKAVNIPVCRFYINYGDGPAMLFPHLEKMRQLARFVAFRTYILTEENRYKEAFNSACVGLKLGESLKDEPILISQLVRIALHRIASASLYSILKTSPEEISIDNYQALILQINKKEKEITKALEVSLAFVSTFTYKKLLKGDVIELYGFWGSESEGTVFEKLFSLFYSYPGRPLLKKDYAFYVHYLTEAISLSRLPYYQAKDKLLEWDRKLGTDMWYKYLISAILIPTLNRSQLSQTLDNAQLDVLKLACALKIYKKQKGYYPEKLTELAPSIIPEIPLDPFTGKDFVYWKQGGGFIVYSLGPNTKDDGGISQQENTEKQNRKKNISHNYDAYDIVWKCEE